MSSNTPYTDKELADAVDFLTGRLEAERAMEHGIEDILSRYARDLLALWYRGASTYEVEMLVEAFINEVMEICYELAVADREEERNAIVLYMNSERNGSTLEERVRQRTDTFIIALGALYLACKLLNIGQVEAYKSALDNLKHPWDNPILVDVRKKIEKGELAGDIGQFTVPHFGRGVEIASMGALQKITASAVADAWMWWQYEDARDEGAKGFYVIRGSSYPCEECDSHTGIFYPIGDEENRPQYHPNCCCIVVYSYVDRL